MKKNYFKRVIVLTIICSIICIITSMMSACVDTGNKNPIVTVRMDPTGKSGIGGSFRIELFPDKAPNSVNYFIELALEGFYDDLYATKVMAGHLVEFGDFSYDVKNNRRVIAGEFAENGFEGNDIKFTRGTVGLCLFKNQKGELDNDSAMGDIFITLSDEAGSDFDGKYAAIGQIVSGIEVLDRISNISTASALSYQPMYSARTEETTINLKGKSFPAAVTSIRKLYSGYVTDDFLNGDTDDEE